MIRFGPSGNSKRFYDEGHESTVDAPKWCTDMGLNAYEYSFGRGINISDEKANSIGLLGNQWGLKVSVHAPYYINFANPDDAMADKSFGYLFRSAQKVQMFFGDRVVFHTSSVGKMKRQEAFELTKKRMEVFLRRLSHSNYTDVWFCPETMGKINQIGDYEEVAELVSMADCLLPTVDFGHQNARTLGGLKTEEDYEHIITHLIDKVGYERTKKMHVHFSKIEYSQGGEVKHLTFADTQFGPEFLPLARVIVKHKLEPVIICESDGTQADDALAMKKIYESVLAEE